MVFNTLDFLVFFVTFYILYWQVIKIGGVRKSLYLILSGSYLFYAWWDWRFLGLIILSTAVDFYTAVILEKTDKKNIRLSFLLISICCNLGILGIFKYCNFFIENFSNLLSLFGLSPEISTLNIILPVGISFYTFQSMSYTIDVYRRTITPTSDLLSFASYVAFFPQLVAGPIERAKHLLPQFSRPRVFDYNKQVSGLRLILFGFFKKVVVADNMAVIVDFYYTTNTYNSFYTTTFASLAFSLQIYADFSGYSDMAIGLSKMLGYNLRKNFNAPYFASSFKEFWRRWHISLSSWFRDYVYFPLGGNKTNRTGRNVMITFLLSGLWHGAHLKFILWGGIHGIALILEQTLRIKTPKWISLLTVFGICSYLWIPFRAHNFSQAIDKTSSLLNFNKAPTFLDSVQLIPLFEGQWILIFISIFILFFTDFKIQNISLDQWISNKPKWVRWGYYYTLVMMILIGGNFMAKPNFIYFQF